MSVRNGLPSLVTVAGMGFGFFSILVAQDGAIDTALWLIFLAVLCDIADGKLARRLGATSAFGAQLDSFADAISFGVAPAVVLYEAALHVFGWLGRCAAFFYAALAVFRLVRFNLDSGERRRDVFRGLSTPGAALHVLSYLALRHELPAAIGGIYALGLGGLMVSSVPSPAFKGEGLSPAYLVVALANTLLLLLRPSWGTFLWWNAFSLSFSFEVTAWRWRRERVGLRGSKALLRARVGGAAEPPRDRESHRGLDGGPLCWVRLNKPAPIVPGAQNCRCLCRKLLSSPSELRRRRLVPACRRHRPHSPVTPACPRISR